MNFQKFIENRIANIQASDSFAFAAAIGFGPWLVPLAPAIIFGYALYVSAPIDMAELRTVTAVAAAIALIVAGAVSSHNAIVTGGIGAWSLVIGYIVLEIVGLWVMSVSFDVKVVGTVASLLTLIVYLSRSTAKEIDNDKAEAKEAAMLKMDFQIEQARLNAEHQRRMAERDIDLKHAEKMARIEVKKLPQTAVPQSVPQSVPQAVPPKSLEALKTEIIAELSQGKPNLSQLAQRLDIGRSTLYRHLGTLTETGEVVKNGNGYEVIK
ncbi:MAG: helix-turn-helix domain-containing protein [Planctomycetota bacterium]